MKRQLFALLIAVCMLSACVAVDGGAEAAMAGESGPEEGPVEARDAGSEPQVCEPRHEVPIRITTGAETEVGTMTVVTSDTQLDLWIEAGDGWGLGDTYVIIGHDGTYAAFSANLEPWATGYVPSIHFAIPLDEVALTCEEVFKLLVQLHVQHTSSGARYFASAVGEVREVPSEGGWRDYYEVCCSVDQVDGCTLTQGYWKNHDAWPVSELLVGSTTYSQAALLALLGTEPEGDASLILCHQLIAALLNVESGASSTEAINDAQAWMAAHGSALPYGIDASTAAGQEAVAISEALTSYNEGRIGPGHCHH